MGERGWASCPAARSFSMKMPSEASSKRLAFIDAIGVESHHHRSNTASVSICIFEREELFMARLEACIEDLRRQLEKHRLSGLKEYPTRTIFIDPLLGALGWDVRDPDSVQLEYPTIDGKAVDYALKINRKAVFLLEAKQLDDPLEDVKAITQVVGYAANDGIEWCGLTNGVRYKVYKSSEKAAAPEKLLFEVSIDPRRSEGIALHQIAAQLLRLSQESMAQGILDKVGEEIFTTGKVRKALDKLFSEPPENLLRLVRKATGDEKLKPTQIRSALRLLWEGKSVVPRVGEVGKPALPISKSSVKEAAEKVKDYGEGFHTSGRPREVVELYRAIDRFCLDLSPGAITRRHLAKYVSWSEGKRIFCCAHLQQSGLRVWVKLKYSELTDPPEFARDMSKVGHWGVGDVELAINTIERLKDAQPLIRQSFEWSRGTH
jgi:predicted transport protein